MDTRERRFFLLGLVEAATTEHNSWAMQPDLTYVTREVDESMSDLIEGFGEGDIPGDCRKLAGLVDEFSTLWEAWQAEVDRTGTAALMPNEATWGAWEAIVKEYQGVSAPEHPRVESVQTLVDQKVGPQQICKIYGWISPGGQYETWKIEEELAKPGKHTADWKDPVQLEREKAAEKQRSLADRVRRQREEKARRMNEPCPESLAELVEQQVPLQQVAKMMRISEEEVLQQCDAEGLSHPPGAPSVQTERGAHEPEMDPALARQFDAGRVERENQQVESNEPPDELLDIDLGIDLGDGPLTLEQEIIQRHKAGLQAAEISTELTTPDRKVTPQKVRGVIGAFERNPERFLVPGE